MADTLLLTEVHMEVDGESRFPEITMGDWIEVSRQGHGRYDFVEYHAV